MTTTVTMPPGWHVRLFIATGLTPVQKRLMVEAESSQKYVYYVLAYGSGSYSVYTCTNCSVVTTSQPTVHIYGDQKQ